MDEEEQARLIRDFEELQLKQSRTWRVGARVNVVTSNVFAHMHTQAIEAQNRSN